MHFFNTHLQASLSTATEAQYIANMVYRQEQLQHAIDFIGTKGPFLEGEIIIFSGDFNTDSLIADSNKGYSTISNMLNNPAAFPLVAANKAAIEGQY